MPILNDIMDHRIIGPAIREGLKKGREEGELKLTRRLLARRFGTLPAAFEERLAKLSEAELEEVSLGLLDGKGIDELFG